MHFFFFCMTFLTGVHLSLQLQPSNQLPTVSSHWTSYDSVTIVLVLISGHVPVLFPQTRMNPSPIYLDLTQESPALWIISEESERVSRPFLYAIEVHTSPIVDISLDSNSLFMSLFPTGLWIASGQVCILLMLAFPGPALCLARGQMGGKYGQYIHPSAHQGWFGWSDWPWGYPLHLSLLLPSPLSNGMIPEGTLVKGVSVDFFSCWLIQTSSQDLTHSRLSMNTF